MYLSCLRSGRERQTPFSLTYVELVRNSSFLDLRDSDGQDGRLSERACKVNHSSHGSQSAGSSGLEERGSAVKPYRVAITTFIDVGV